MTLLEREPTEGLQASRSPVLRDRPAGAARPASGRRQGDQGADQRPPHRREHGAHSASLHAEGREGVHRDRERRPPAAVRHHAAPTGGSSAAAASARCARDGPEIGYWIGVPHWGNGYATEAARAAHRPCLRRPRLRGAAGRRARDQPGVAARAGEVRLPVDRRGAATGASRSARRRRRDRFRLDRGLWASLRNWGKVLPID